MADVSKIMNGAGNMSRTHYSAITTPEQRAVKHNLVVSFTLCTVKFWRTLKKALSTLKNKLIQMRIYSIMKIIKHGRLHEASCLSNSCATENYEGVPGGSSSRNIYHTLLILMLSLCSTT